MANCKACLAAFKKNQLRLSCVDCKSEFHAKCVKMTQADIDYLEEQGSAWRCGPCSDMRRKSMRLEVSSQQGGLTLNDIMETLRDMQADQKKNVEDFNKSYEVLQEKMNENSETLKTEVSKIAAYLRLIEELQTENKMLKNKVAVLEMRVEDMESYSRRNCVEIHGVPEERDEKTIEVVKRVGNALNIDVQDEMVDACHRLGKRSDDRPRGIIVKFVRRTDKEVFLQKRREKKRDFSTRHMDMAMDTPVFVNESLSLAKRKLLLEARKLKNEKSYKYLWIRNGNILLRKMEQSQVVEIRTQADLSKLL